MTVRRGRPAVLLASVGVLGACAAQEPSSPAVTSTVPDQPTRVDLDGHVIEAATPQTYARMVAAVGSLGAGACAATPR